jgi:hypothetical protein
MKCINGSLADISEPRTVKGYHIKKIMWYIATAINLQ